MKTLLRRKAIPVCLLAMVPVGWSVGGAQYRQEPGRSIGSVTTKGNLIVLTLDEGALGKANLFNLAHCTLRFTPDGGRYRVETLPSHWDGEFGTAMTGSEASLKNFAFPFSGGTWNTFSVGMTGSLTFGQGVSAGRGGERNAGGGLAVDRFAELQQAAPSLINTVPAISVFFKPRLSGTRYLKELNDRAVVTWNVSEPYGGIQDMSWTPTVNRFQAVLHKDGTIELSYEDVHAEDAIVGVYPVVSAGKEVELGSMVGDGSRIKNVKVSAVDGLFLKLTLEMQGGLSAEDAGVYRVCVDHAKPGAGCTQNAGTVWTIQRGGGRGRNGGNGAGLRYFASGAGMQPGVTVDGQSLSVEGILPAGYKSGDEVYVSVSVQAAGAAAVENVPAHALKLAGVASPEVDFAAVKKGDGPYAVAYEAFHYMKTPRAVDLTCSVIKGLGDKFDMLAYYSDFRIDNPEAGTSSTGPLGGGPAGGEVTGIGAKQRNLASYCSRGRFQWQFIQPVYVGANQMQEYPPADLKEPSNKNIGFYTGQLAERTGDGKIPPYDYAMSQIGHEMGHRWSAFVSAKVGGEMVTLGPTHWAKGLQAPVAFPYQRPTEASAMGGGVWQDNYDGTFTQLDDDYYVPATGWSYLDLYLMGMISPAEVPDFFLLKNLVAIGHDANGHAIYKADRTTVTIQDVIAAEGARLPGVEQAQKKFNTGMVLVVEHGKEPSAKLMENVTGIRERWMDYWETTTGHRSTMTADPK